MSSVERVSPSWKGYTHLNYLFVFGDSYSDISRFPNAPKSTTVNPLGVPFPGHGFTEALDKPNWVGHLIKGPANPEGQELLVYDYAVGGETVTGVRKQVDRYFLRNEGSKPEWAPWTAEDSLFVTWVGINDIGQIMFYGPEDLEPSLRVLIEDVQEKLYEAGAKNFLVIDVPPIHRSPAVPEDTELPVHEPYLSWNAQLRVALTKFSQEHPDATVLLYSSFDSFTRMLDDPVLYGFKKGDVRKMEGSMWMDHLHPTSAVHRIVAREVEVFLRGVPGAEAS